MSFEEEKNFYSMACGKVEETREKINTQKADVRQLQSEIRNTTQKQQMKKMAIDARQVQIRECDRSIQKYQQEYASLLDASFQSDPEEGERIKSRILQLRQQAEAKEQEKTVLQNEINNLNQEMSELQARKNTLNEKLSHDSEILRGLYDWCKKAAHSLGSEANRIRGVASGMENETRKLQNISTTYRFGSNTAGANSGFRSNSAKEGNMISNAMDKLAQQLRSMAQDDTNDREHEIER